METLIVNKGLGMNTYSFKIGAETEKLENGILFNDTISKYFEEKIKYLTEKYNLEIPPEFC